MAHQFVDDFVFWIHATNYTEAAESSLCNHEPTVFRCVEYLRNYDGDTITFRIPDVHALIGESISVRVVGIDTPEMKGKGRCEKDLAIEARDLVKQTLSKAKRIDLVNVGRDKYFRILADVVVDGMSLKTILLNKNLAYPYDGRTKANPDWCTMKKIPILAH